ncbi:hypothetical protein KP509_11G005600 [Ceratopteris richardii]|nr:hypothetical protein KP509_11G005600 [Ceratopteris richardii]
MFSMNSTYSLGFIQLNSTDSSTDNFLLAVAIGVGFRTPPATAVWIANPDRPVKENASLRIGPSGKMILQDWDGTEVWSSGGEDVKAVAMQEFGDLVFFNSTNSSEAFDTLVWRSWISTVQQVLVQGQALPTGSILVSNLSSTNSSEGLYRLVMEPAGAILYAKRGSTLQPYWALGFPGFDDYESIQSPCFLNASSTDITSSLVYSGQQISVSYAGEDKNATLKCPAINSSSNAWLPFGSSQESNYRFIRLDDDGNLRGYITAPVLGQGSTREWAVDYELFPTGTDAECRLPNVCGPYGVCNKGQCSCPGSGSADAFVQANNLDAKAGCVPPRTLVCNKSSPATDNHYLSLPQVDYFLNNFSAPLANVTTLEECQSLCSSNCSCDAFFFDGNTRACFQTRDLGSLILVSGTAINMTAYLKVQNLPDAPPAALFDDNKSNTLSGGAIAGIVIGATAALLVLVLTIFRRRWADRGPIFIDPDEEEERAFLAALPGLPPRFTLKELQMATGGFKTRLGAGGFGDVFAGVLKDGSRVAVKRLHGAQRGHKEFRAEVATLGSINHVNLVRLRGFCAEKGERLLVYELVENGSLDKYIFRGKQEQSGPNVGDGDVILSWDRRLDIAIGTAKGLAYLHEECRETILHLDIKPQNVLLNESFVPKVADFGMARLMEAGTTEAETAVRGTPGYLAPEWLRACIVTKKCDVYSFGMLLLELIAGRKNFDPSLGTDPSFFYFPTWAKLKALEGKYVDLVDERIRKDVEADEKQEEVVRASKVAFCCIHEDPLMRPTMVDVVRMLEGLEAAIPTVGALGLVVKEGDVKPNKGPSWSILFADSESVITSSDTTNTSIISNLVPSGPR